ncbi:hypothetical protein C8F04DRAFT_1202733 [Mycena alexandri]|uniref:Uncharacterized protein n=1 Tax=Mycena alexandri TaxID=1745969 RepID=A0AAD6RVW0_9AGAR|nr:hypothetical protein C8F04DRAFT_1202733 [Mycena alexandri]
MIPPRLEALADPPADFVPCRVPEHMGHNFLGHIHFSSKHNKTYWLLMGPLREGVYSLKIDCTRAQRDLGLMPESSVFVASVDEWKDVLLVWAKFCFHRHRKCDGHPAACVLGCPGHERQVAEAAPLRRDRKVKGQPTVKKEPNIKEEPTVKKEIDMPSMRVVKREMLSPAVKREAGETAAKRKAELQSPSSSAITPLQRSSRRAPRARKAPILSYSHSSSDEVEVESVDSDFFFLPDSPTPAVAKGSEATAPVETAAKTEGAPASRATSPTMSTVSSLSVSSFPASKASTNGDTNGDAKGKGRAVPRASVAPSFSRTGQRPAVIHPTLRADTRGDSASSMSRAGASSAIAGTSAVAGSISQAVRPSASRGPARGDIFYVSARGAVHHSRSQAFRDIGAGPIQPVVGYNAAITYADTLVLQQDSADDSTMDLDAE